MTNTSVIAFSEIETDILGLKFGRYNTEEIDEVRLKEEIEQGRYDVVRIKTNCQDEFGVRKMHRTGYPFYFSGGVRRYRVNCIEAPLPSFTQPEVNFELFTGERKDLLEKIMNESCGDYPIGYYRTPGLGERITREMESKCLFEFYSRFNNNSLFPNNYLWFMKLNQEYVGFIALNIYREKDMVDSTLAGLLKSYQGHGLFPNILRHIRGFCRQQGITYFCCGGRNENMFSQRAFEKDFMKCDGVEYIFHMLPMLTTKWV